MSLREANISSVEPSKEKKNLQYEMIFFDLDGTLILPGYQETGAKVGASVWRAVFESVGALGEHKRMKEKFERGEYPSYMDWTAEEYEVLKRHRLTESKLSEVVNKLSLVKGAKESIPKLKSLGYKTAIITGGVLALAERVQKELGIDEVVAHCDFIFDEKGELKDRILVPCDYEDKAKVFLQMTKKNGVAPLKCIYIGNDVNDSPVFPLVGLPYIFNPCRKEARRSAVVADDSGDMLLALQRINVLPKN